MSDEVVFKDAYEKNEVRANYHMTYALFFTGFLLFLVWFGYYFKLFDVGHATWLLTVIVIPIVVVQLCIPLAFIKSKFLASPKYKYFAIALLVIAISVLNVIMPKHAVLGWALCITLTAHYYNRGFSRIMFFVVLFMMLVSLGLGTFYGEFDANLLSGELDKKTQTLYSVRLSPMTFPDTPAGRYQMLKELINVGENRFVKIFTQYFLGRALFIILIYVITSFLNKRTNALLTNQIVSSNENMKNKTELEVAKEIQINTLPFETEISKDIEIVGELKPAKEVGGDLYDYLDIDENHVAILIGDVSGKGVPAAMFMMKTITSFRDFATKDKTPAQILKEVNASIFKGNKSSLFVTCFLAIIDKRTGVVKFANAGHNPPVVGSNGNYRILPCKPGFLLGCFEKSFIEDEEFTLAPGESITLYTDGITEARNNEGNFFGEERLLRAMNKRAYSCIIELHHAIKDEIGSFVVDAPQSDDITFITLKYRGASYTYEEKLFDGKMENIPSMLSFIEEFADSHHLDEDFKNKLTIVGDELFSNIIKYGYKDNGGDIFVRLLYETDNHKFVLTVIDRAEEFNQLAVEDRELSGDAKKHEIGGLGLLIVKKIMNEYVYDRVNGKNILILKKNFDE